MAFYCVCSNKLEVLARSFFEKIIRTREVSLFAKEQVIVQTQGIATWLKQKVAEECGIAVNLDTPFQDAFIHSIMRTLLPEDVDPQNLFSREMLTWRIFQEFCRNGEKYEGPHRYFHGNAPELKKFQLAQRCASLFDQYQIYHGQDLLERWLEEQDPEQNWQKELYKVLAQTKGRPQKAFQDFCGLGKIRKELLPGRVSIFGISSMPPMYLNFFLALSRSMDVYFFYLNPCRDLWDDLDRIKTARQLKENDSANSNPLLALYAQQGRTFFSRIAGMDQNEELQIDDSLFCDFAGEHPTTLQIVQQSILDNRKLEVGTERIPETRSLQIHSCHSPLREVEVLHDRILDFLNQGNNVRDVLVTAPDISLYEPLINAVFSTGPLRNLYTFSDRSLRRSNHTGAVFLDLLRLRCGKYPVNEIFDLLDYGAISMKWEFSEEEKRQLRVWFSNLHTAWGIDAAHRKELTGKEFDDFSWRKALKRFLYGCALPCEPEKQADDPVIPFDACEGSGGITAGKFIDFMEALFHLKEELSGARTLTEWCSTLEEILDRFFQSSNENAKEIQTVRQTLHHITEIAHVLALQEILPPEFMIFLLENSLDTIPEKTLFLHGRITCCSMIPMRSIPMKFIAVLGLDHDAFPRRDRSVEFNVIPVNQQKADHSRSLEDRYLFLETLLSAREELHLFYEGADCRSNTEKPPAVPLEELCDYLSALFDLPKEKLITKHHLQAFHKDYFTPGNKLSSWSMENYLACLHLNQEEQIRAPSPAEDLKNLAELPAEENLKDFPVRDFIKCFLNPAKKFLTAKTGLEKIYDSSPDAELSGEEPFELGYREQSGIAKKILHWRGENPPFPEKKQFAVLRKTDELPPFGLGEEIFRTLSESISFTEEDLTQVRRMKDFSVDLRLGEYHLSGTVPALEDGSGQYHLLYGMFEGNKLEIYLNHLILCSLREGVFCCAKDFQSGSSLVLQTIPMKSARVHLQKLLELCGSADKKPLPFFAAPGIQYAESGKDKIKAAENAYYSEKFYPEYHEKGSYTDFYVRKLYGKDLFQDDDFVAEFIMCTEMILKEYLPVQPEKEECSK